MVLRVADVSPHRLGRKPSGSVHKPVVSGVIWLVLALLALVGLLVAANHGALSL